VQQQRQQFLGRQLDIDDRRLYGGRLYGGRQW
jgi:hypothetical protein